ncbi:Octaprenyl diphosphate synthase / Dimethylallyltransferase / (2E,6E)-farnesyl diphosphate synthase / Geranylgeranyl diphosphate synthase [hydrothermal vent metagenome]|uniref:Octaprenyl diphosphate synthase / Dimethylallyltransferase / (2E,6E)-farnesyl diphosphate synthase / Geranylgeranyl diphosphate synthase n=1 Tax=hydrothermal vent metagenome TaxID=652676 RepID=A0A1W1EIB2_9ZZZZ
MQRFEIYLKNNLPKVDSFHPIYEDALGCMLQAGGKRFRPLLLLNLVEAYQPLLYNSALPVALAIEMFHTYSLIHDDLPSMDNSPLRRGYQTIHTKYDETTAILVGDALNSDAFLLIAQAPLRDDVKIKLVEVLALNGGGQGMVLGQALDCYFENTPLTITEVKELHINKTAKLIASSLLMGAIIVDLDKTTQNNLYEFGINLGLLFQIQDDIIDETLSDEEAGKPTSNDGDKNSFINILGLEESIREADILASKLDIEFNKFDDNIKKALEKIVKKYLYRHKK